MKELEIQDRENRILISSIGDTLGEINTVLADLDLEELNSNRNKVKINNSEAVDLIGDKNSSTVSDEGELQKTSETRIQDELRDNIINSRKQQRRWSDIVVRNRSRSEGSSLKFIPSSIKEERIVVYVPKDEVKQEEEKWKYALMESVLGDSPSFRRIESYALNRRRNLGFNLSIRYELMLLHLFSILWMVVMLC